MKAVLLCGDQALTGQKLGTADSKLIADTPTSPIRRGLAVAGLSVCSVRVECVTLSNCQVSGLARDINQNGQCHWSACFELISVNISIAEQGSNFLDTLL
jgi:hypothetical protein